MSPNEGKDYTSATSSLSSIRSRSEPGGDRKAGRLSSVVDETRYLSELEGKGYRRHHKKHKGRY